MATSYSIAYGRRVNLFLVRAIALGNGVAIGASLLRLGSLLSASPFWFGAVRCGGALYLAYLGIGSPFHCSAVRRTIALWQQLLLIVCASRS